MAARATSACAKDLLRQLGVGPGDQIEIELVEDHQERVVVEPPELTQALADNAAAKAAYEKLPFTHRNEYARWIDEGKSPRPALIGSPRQSDG